MMMMTRAVVVINDERGRERHRERGRRRRIRRMEIRCDDVKVL
jgi:hypothetical protein